MFTFLDGASRAYNRGLMKLQEAKVRSQDREQCKGNADDVNAGMNV